MTTRLIGIIGGPATGKSTLMKSILTELRVNTDSSLMVKGKNSRGSDIPMGTADESTKTFVFGVYGEGDVFPGTDRLSMEVAAVIPPYLQENLSKYSGWTFLFEGSRLTSLKFLESLSRIGIEINLYCLTAPMDDGGFLSENAPGSVTRAERMANRESKQDETWVTGRDSAAENVYLGLSGKINTCERLDHSTPEDTAKLTARILHGK